MRYFCYKDYNNHIITKSEEEILKEYYPSWYKSACDIHEQSYVDENFSFEDCLTDWVLIHKAWISL